MAFEIPCLLTINAYHGSFDFPNNAANPHLHPSRPAPPNMNVYTPGNALRVSVEFKYTYVRCRGTALPWHC